MHAASQQTCLDKRQLLIAFICSLQNYTMAWSILKEDSSFAFFIIGVFLFIYLTLTTITDNRSSSWCYGKLQISPILSLYRMSLKHSSLFFLTEAQSNRNNANEPCHNEFGHSCRSFTCWRDNDSHKYTLITIRQEELYSLVQRFLFKCNTMGRCHT